MNKHVPPPDAKAQPDDAQAGKSQPIRKDARQAPPDHGPQAHPLTKLNRRLPWKAVVAAGVVVAIAVGAFVWWQGQNTEPKVGYSVAKVSYGTVRVSVRAPAIVEPTETIDVVARVGGRVESMAVKSGDRVMKGQILARLVSNSARDELTAAQAELASRQADSARAEADAGEARAAALRARAGGKPNAIDAAEARLARAIASANESRALLRAGEASLSDARTAVQSLDVRAPADGMVLTTGVEPERAVRAIARGQRLLTLVPDLSKVNLRANFGESSVGSLRVGAHAEFTAPAFPRRSFPATLSGLDLGPKREAAADGKVVVRYPATLTAANPDGVLRPGMSANVAIIVAEAKNVLAVPNTALSFTPLPKIESKFPPLKQSASDARMGRVWVMRDDILKPRDVALGLSDARVTQIVSGPLREGENVVTSALIAAGNKP